MTLSADLSQKPARPGIVALLSFSTRSPRGARADASFVNVARTLRRRGVRCRVFHVHLDPADESENRRRVELLVRRVLEEGARFAVARQFWTPDVVERLSEAGVSLIEQRAHTVAESTVVDRDVAAHEFSGCLAGEPLDETAELIVPIGLPDDAPVAHVDLNVSLHCTYKRGLEANAFYADVLDAPELRGYRGCAHCLSALPDSSVTTEEVATEIIDCVRDDRVLFPSLETIWVPFAETFYDALLETFDRARGDEAFRDLTFAMQCRPDALARRAADVEEIARRAHACGARLRIAVVGFENFSPRDLEVLNRGVDPRDLEEAAATLRRWSREPPEGLVVAGYTPSFILFTPWTRPADLTLNLREIERHDLWAANIERLRVGPGTPAFEKARRAGLVVDGPVRMAVHPNGYSSEREIRFADGRTAAIASGFETLKPLAPNDQPELLAGVMDAVGRAADPAGIDWGVIASAWRRLSDLVRGEAGDVRDAAPSEGRPRPAHVDLAVGPSCNNGCRACIWTRRLDDGAAGATHGDASAPEASVRLAGREPTVRADLLPLVRRLRERGADRIEIETNGRMLAYDGFARALAEAGVSAVAVKLFADDAAAWDAHTRVPGSFEQTMRGLAVLRHAAPQIERIAVLIPRRQPGAAIDALLRLARESGFARARVELRLAKLDLLALPELPDRVRALRSGVGTLKMDWIAS